VVNAFDDHGDVSSTATRWSTRRRLGRRGAARARSRALIRRHSSRPAHRGRVATPPQGAPSPYDTGGRHAPRPTHRRPKPRVRLFATGGTISNRWALTDAGVARPMPGLDRCTPSRNSLPTPVPADVAQFLDPSRRINVAPGPRPTCGRGGIGDRYARGTAYFCTSPCATTGRWSVGRCGTEHASTRGGEPRGVFAAADPRRAAWARWWCSTTRSTARAT
jgi:hypothetical protein